MSTTNQKNSCQRTNNKLKQILQMLDSFLWTDVPGLIVASLWKIYGSKYEQKYPDRNDCVAVVTSGEKNSEVFLIRDLAKRGFSVVVGAKNPDSCERLQELIKNERFPGSVNVFALDLGSIKSVQEFAENINKKYPDVSLLVNNHHNLFSNHSLTGDGFESNLAANYLGHFYLTHLLLNNLKRTGENRSFYSRVVNITSPEFFGVKINFGDINLKKDFNSKLAYGQAKLAMLMMIKHMDELMQYHHMPIKFYAVNAGLLNTSQMNTITKNPLLSWILPLIQIKPSESAQSILYVCLSKKLEMFGGKYLSNCVESFTSSYSKNTQHQEKLFKVTCDLLDLNVFGTESAQLVKKQYHPY